MSIQTGTANFWLICPTCGGRCYVIYGWRKCWKCEAAASREPQT